MTETIIDTRNLWTLTDFNTGKSFTGVRSSAVAQAKFTIDIMTVITPMLCHKCGHKTCVNCKVLYHGGEVCEMFQQNLIESADAGVEDESNNIVNYSTNRCPRYNMHIERNGGCERMTCKWSPPFCNGIIRFGDL